ncbi:MAG: imidazole glycerol phosphate synthase subunit HisH [Thermodesulfovibrionales bacterium]|nr:imidazole glycerol phosphate synthase subunit HisH [Thermodesulfovibrionales bacterium]
MIAIIDYGMGNLKSVLKAFLKLGIKASITSNINDIKNSRGIVLPGVGAFADCMKNLDRLKLIETIEKEITTGKPYFGICLGLQILFSESEEFGFCKGMNILKGKVNRFNFENISQNENLTLKVPHMGWNSVEFTKKHLLFTDIPNNSYFYFVHSYYVIPEESDIIAGKTNYGYDFTSIVIKDNILAVQFHPEKSQTNGLKILNNFNNFCNKC